MQTDACEPPVSSGDASLQQRVQHVWRLYQRAADLDPANPAVYTDFAGFVEQVLLATCMCPCMSPSIVGVLCACAVGVLCAGAVGVLCACAVGVLCACAVGVF